MVKQTEASINNVNVPMIEEGEVRYYPISYIGSKILLKDLSPSQLRQNGYGEHINQFNVDFGKVLEGKQGVQYTYCISEEGLRVILLNCKIARLSVEQKKAMVGVCQHISLEIEIDTEEKFLDSYPETKWKKYDFWLVECIGSLLKVESDVKWQRCSKCNRYLPYHSNFWTKESNPKNKQLLRCICNECKKTHIEYCGNKELTKAYYDGGERLYRLYKDNDVNIYKIYELYFNDVITRYPRILQNNIHVNNIINRYFKQKILDNINTFSLEYVSQISKIPIHYISAKAIDRNIVSKFKREEILNSNIENDTTKIKTYSVKRLIVCLTFNDAKEMIDSCLKKYNIIIEDVYTYNYDILFEKAKVKWYVLNTEKDKLGFVMKYFDNKYAAYKFKIQGQKYWKDRNNADLAMRYFIEQDLKLDIGKIPLYVTKNNLQMKCRTLYNILYEKRFDGNLFEWINRLYPNRFIAEDFAIGIIRNEFDSMEEKMVDDMLRQEFKNVVYNNRQGDNKVSIMGMEPDWFIYTDNNVYIVEYFGIALSQFKYNQRISDYIDKSEIKITKYNELPYGKKIFLYPEDIRKDNIGFYEKIKDIV